MTNFGGKPTKTKQWAGRGFGYAGVPSALLLNLLLISVQLTCTLIGIVQFLPCSASILSIDMEPTGICPDRVVKQELALTGICPDGTSPTTNLLYQEFDPTGNVEFCG